MLHSSRRVKDVVHSHAFSSWDERWIGQVGCMYRPNSAYVTAGCWRMHSACSQAAGVSLHLCAAAGSANYPFEEIVVHLPHLVKQCKQLTHDMQSQNTSSKQPESPLQTDHPGTSNSLSHGATKGSTSSVKVGASDAQNVVVVCRRGNDSQHIVQSLRQWGVQSVVDLIGGLSAWSQHADQSFPNY